MGQRGAAQLILDGALQVYYSREDQRLMDFLLDKDGARKATVAPCMMIMHECTTQRRCMSEV